MERNKMSEENENETTEQQSVETKQIEQPAILETKQVEQPVIIEDKEWQKKLLPFMMAVLVGLTVFFIVASYIEFRDFKVRLDKQSNSEELKTILDNAENRFSAPEDKDKSVEYTKWRTMVWLEKESISQRYTHSNTLILSRMWTRYIGFLVGMIMGIVGAVFILGKLRESETKLGAEANLFKFSVTSASPGIILAVLGTLLLLTTIVVKTDVKVGDGNLYLPRMSDNKTSMDTDEPPADFSIDDDDSSENSNKLAPTNSGNSNKSENSNNQKKGK
jgi:biopolymer transport protein ExbD